MGQRSRVALEEEYGGGEGALQTVAVPERGEVGDESVGGRRRGLTWKRGEESAEGGGGGV